MPREILPQLLNGSQAAKYLGMGRTRFYLEVLKGNIRQHSTPAKNGIPAKRPSYWIKDLDRYIEDNLDLNPAGKVWQSIGQRKTIGL